MNYDNIVILTGGTGTVKLINGLYRIIPDKLSIITNTADDFSFYGLHVSPDTDALLYSLSGLLDKKKFWGISNDSFTVKTTLENLDKNKENSIARWFNLGDKDLAYCLYRTSLVKNNKTLSEAVDIVAKILGIRSKIFPMADSPIGTYFTTVDDKEYHLEEYFIRLRTQPPIKKIEIRGTERAKVSKELIKTIQYADLIIIGPSNPISSIGPILKIREIHQKIVENSCPKLVISPIIGSNPISGPAHKYMENEGYEVSPLGIFSFYEGIGTHFMFDSSDEEEYADRLYSNAQNRNQTILFEDIIIQTIKSQVDLAQIILNLELS